MVYFVRFCVKVHFAFVGVLLYTSAIDGAKDTLPEVNTVIDFLQNVIRPYVDKLKKSGEHVYRASLDNNIKKVIDKKIIELKPILQDFDESNESNVNDAKETQDGNEETSILEFVPNIKEDNKKALRNKPDINNSNKIAINKLKKDKQNIEKALQKELVSKKTQRMVTKILDKLIAQLIENQCTWKSTSHRALMRGKHDSDGAIVVSKWHEEWTQLKNRYASYLNTNSKTEPSEGLKVFQFFDQFHDFITHIAKDTHNLSDRYKIVCQLIDQKDGDTGMQFSKNINSNSSHTQKENSTDNFRVCSEELIQFLSMFYALLNDTAISTFKNYAAMYVRDVNTASVDEKQHVVEVVENICRVTERKVSKTFIKETSQFELDKNKDKLSNMEYLKTYIKRTIEFVKEHMRNILKRGLIQFKATLRTSIEKDLLVNLDQDLVNLEEDFKNRISKMFTSCNGKMNGRRNDLIFDTHNRNKNSIYVKLQLDLDDDFKDLFNSNVLDNLMSDSKKYPKNTLGSFNTSYIKANVQRKHINFSVTRTTTSDSTNKSTINSNKYMSGIIVEVFNNTKSSNKYKYI